YRGLQDLKASLDRWRALDPDIDPAQRAHLASLVQSQAAAIELAVADPEWGADAGEQIGRLGRELFELETTLIPHGLHVVGTPPSAAERAETIDVMGITDPGQR